MKLACLREPDFFELYKHLGDKVTQDRIRDAHSDEHHCYILRDCAMACESLPKDIGDIQAGSPCPNNPYVTHAELIERKSEQAELLEHGRRLSCMADLGIMPGAQELSPQEFLVAAIMRRHVRELEVQAYQEKIKQALRTEESDAD